MTWTKKKDTDQERDFWSHVETVAQRVRGSEVYSNHRVGQTQTKDSCDRPSGMIGGDRRTQDHSLKRA
jgi:hypothetical protein